MLFLSFSLFFFFFSSLFLGGGGGSDTRRSQTIRPLYRNNSNDRRKPKSALTTRDPNVGYECRIQILETNTGDTSHGCWSACTPRTSPSNTPARRPAAAPPPPRRRAKQIVVFLALHFSKCTPLFLLSAPRLAGPQLSGGYTCNTPVLRKHCTKDRRGYCALRYTMYPSDARPARTSNNTYTSASRSTTYADHAQRLGGFRFAEITQTIETSLKAR